MNIKILVCCHKKDFMVSNDVYCPIQVGKHNHPEVDLGIQCDDKGDNISNKNDSYCELTGMYWAWKNMTGVDVIGLCHYRRYFDFYDSHIFKNQINYTLTSDIHENSFKIPHSLQVALANGTIVVPKKRVLSISLKQAYCSIHSCEDLKLLEELIRKTQPQKYIMAYDKVMRYGNKISCYNMFLMKWEMFDEYCKWLFDLLFAYEKCVDVSHYTDYQKRLFGFISERLFNVYIEANHLRIIERPVMLLGDVKSKPYGGFVYSVHACLNNIIFKLNKIVNGKSM